MHSVRRFRGAIQWGALLVVGASMVAPMCAAASASALAPMHAGSSARALEDPLRELAAWTERAAQGKRDPDEKAQTDVPRWITELRALERGSPERQPEVDLALLDLAALSEGREPASALGRLAELGRSELDDRLTHAPEGVSVRFIAEEVLAGRPGERRARAHAAIELVTGRFLVPTLDPLLDLARGDDAPLAARARNALVGWGDMRVHLYFLQMLDRGSFLRPGPFEHVHAAGSAFGPEARARLRASIGRLYLSPDWRAAVRAEELVATLTLTEAVPLLVEALALWSERASDRRGNKRVQSAIEAELERRSGRSLGPSPDRWRAWWKSVQTGQIVPPREDPAGRPPEKRATFFGLPLESDRVLFLVDRSGSMADPFGPDTGAGKRTRFEQATYEIFAALERAGPTTRFGLVLFSDGAERWHAGLSQANPTNLAQARSFLRGRGPDGGTELRAGIVEALRLDLQGRRVEEQEVDTIMVLCDGETSEGPEWVEEWMGWIQASSPVRFHCVQIGTAGDGTLQALAKESGGDFLERDG